MYFSNFLIYKNEGILAFCIDTKYNIMTYGGQEIDDIEKIAQIAITGKGVIKGVFEIIPSIYRSPLSTNNEEIRYLEIILASCGWK